MMMADNPKVTVEVEAKGTQQAKAQTNDFKKALDALVASGNQTNLRLQQIAEQTKKVEDTTRRAKKETSMLSGAMDNLKKAVVAYVSINTVKYIADTADKMRLLEARTINASKGIALGTQNFEALKKVAISTGTSLEGIVTVFQRISNTKNSIGATNAEMLVLTDTVSKLGVLSGASGEAIKNSLVQFSQAMAGGIVRAEEFNSIVENTPEIAIKIAEGLGVSMGKLRLMVIEGKLLSKDVFDVLIKQADDVNKEFDKMPMTFGRLKSQADITFASLVADIDKSTDASGSLLRSLGSILKSLEDNRQGWVALGSGLVVFFRSTVNVVQALVRSILGSISFVVEATLDSIVRVANKGNQILKALSFGKLAVPTGGLEFALDVAKNTRKGFFKDAGTDFQQIGNEFKAPKVQRSMPIPRDIRGTVETPLSKTGKGKKAKEGESEAQKEAERYADALKGLKEKARDAMLEVQGMDKAIQALSSGGIKAYEAQLKQNEGLGRYNELMGDYLGKGKRELELLAQSIVKREQDTEAKKKQLELSVSLKEAMNAVNIEEGKQKALRDAFLAGGEKALELKQRELDIEQRKRDLLKGSNATDEQKKQAEEQAKREQGLKDYQSTTDQMVESAKQAGEGIRNALRSAFDNTIEHMVNGTASFKDIMVGLLRQIAVQLIKVYALQLLTGFIGGHMTGGASAGANAGIFDKIGGAFNIKAIPATGKAGGGAVNANQPYMVGEAGREMFVPRSAGNIIPNHAMPSGGGGGGITVINNVTVNTQGGGKGDNQGLAEAGKAISEMIEMKVRQVLKTESRQGGMLQRGFA
jgi:tape measure domain-containing protein